MFGRFSFSHPCHILDCVTRGFKSGFRNFMVINISTDHTYWHCLSLRPSHLLQKISKE